MAVTHARRNEALLALGRFTRQDTALPFLYCLRGARSIRSRPPLPSSSPVLSSGLTSQPLQSGSNGQGLALCNLQETVLQVIDCRQIESDKSLCLGLETSRDMVRNFVKVSTHCLLSSRN